MPDDDELRILSEITDWMRIHSEGIHGTQPWKIAGEGPGMVKTNSGAGMNGTPEHFNERERKDLTAADIRFTTKAAALYAFVMGQNSRDIRIGALAPSRGLEERRIVRIDLLGSPERLQWKVNEQGLMIGSPRQWPSQHAVAFKIRFAA
jgi:alpha-L-fucosidase